MQTAIDYLDKTESAMRKLFEGIDSYMTPLRRSSSVCFVSSTVDDEDRRVEQETWLSVNKGAIAESFQTQREFVAESFAQAALCGAVLQIAAKAIEMYSVVKEAPPEWASVIGDKNKAVHFCYGRPIRGVPLGLVIYAGRNQHTHFQDKKLHEPNNTVFERLSSRNDDGRDLTYHDPAYDLLNNSNISFANNIMCLLGWDNYETYRADILTMFSRN
jgi:hypothetical protein